MRLAKSSHNEIQAFGSKCNHFLNSTSTASSSATEVKLVLEPLRLIFAHFDTRLIAKADLNHFMAFSETASDDLKMASELKSIFFTIKKTMKYIVVIVIHHLKMSF